MQLSPKAIQEFKDICRKEFGVEQSDAEAEARALAVLDLYWLVFAERVSDSTASNLDALEPEGVR